MEDGQFTQALWAIVKSSCGRRSSKPGVVFIRDVSRLTGYTDLFIRASIIAFANSGLIDIVSNSQTTMKIRLTKKGKETWQITWQI